MPSPLPNEALDRILSAAETLFAQHGYDGTTLRQVTREAGVNLAAVNYYHGDKQSLYMEVVRRRLHSINQTRLAALTDAERKAEDAPVQLERLIEILARPLFELCADERGRCSARLVGRCLSEPLPFMEKFLAEELQPVLARFAQAIRRHYPALSPEEFLWRFSFVIGALQHTLATLHQMKALTRGICRDHDHDGALECFVHSAAAVFARNPPG
jgi:AcrR family transcriptional regulator